MHPEICKHFIELTNFIKEVMEDRTEEDFHMFWHRSHSTSFQPSSFDENKYNYVSMGLTASLNPTPFNPRFMPKPSNQGYSTQILLLINRMQISIFFTKVKEALFGAKR